MAFDDRGVPAPGRVTQNRYEGCYVDCSVAQFVNPSMVEWTDGYVLGGLGILVVAEHGFVDRLTVTTTEFMGGGISLSRLATSPLGVSFSAENGTATAEGDVVVTDTVVDGNQFFPVPGGYGPNRTNTSTARASRASQTASSAEPKQVRPTKCIQQYVLHVLTAEVHHRCCLIKNLPCAATLRLLIMQRWQFDFCGDLLFMNITAVRHSFTAAAGFPVVVARPPVDGGCVVVLELDHAAAGTMVVDVDTSRYRGGFSLRNTV